MSKRYGSDSNGDRGAAKVSRYDETSRPGSRKGGAWLGRWEGGGALPVPGCSKGLASGSRRVVGGRAGSASAPQRGAVF